MAKYTVRLLTPVAIATIAFMAACGGDKGNADSALAKDTTLNRDLALAGRDTAAQPALTDVPASKAPATTTTKTKSTTTTTTKASNPARPAATKTVTKTASGNTVTKGTGGGGSTGVIPAGSALNLRSNSEICTNTNHVGDKFTATLNEAVVGSNGATIPAGATVTLTVRTLKRSENINDKIVMEFSVENVSFGSKTYALGGASVTSAAVDRVRSSTRGDDAKKVVAGAAIGAIAGQVLGKNTKSTVIGAAAGAAAGGAAAAATSNYEGCVRAGGNLVVTLGSPVTVTL